MNQYLCVDAAYCEEINGRLMGLLIRLGDRLDSDAQDQIQEFLDHNELGLALETMADTLSDAASAISDRERGEVLVLVADMQMDDRVPRVLALCPHRHLYSLRVGYSLPGESGPWTMTCMECGHVEQGDGSVSQIGMGWWSSEPSSDSETPT